MVVIIASILVLAISCLHATASSSCAQTTGANSSSINNLEPISLSGADTFQTIRSTNSNGHEIIELAFRAPAKGVPSKVLDLYCANIKLRLYWGVYRETIKSTARTGQDVRRMARLTRHYYPEIRAVDNPFDAPKLSKYDDWFDSKELGNNNDNNNNNNANGEDSDGGYGLSMPSQVDANSGPQQHQQQHQHQQGMGMGKIGQIKMKIKQKLTMNRHENNDYDDLNYYDADQEDKQIKQKMDESLGESLDSEQHQQQEGAKSTIHSKTKTKLHKIREYLKKYAPKIGMGLYTRWATLWWLMMSCLYTKYYLWDPALDEFIKLKKTMIMYPDFLMLRLQDIDCLPTKFFKSIITACKTLNPLLNFSFGQLSLDNMMRFKNQAN